MPGFLVRMLVTAAGLWLASALVPGVRITGAGTLLGAALILGVVNAVVRPVMVVLTFPITILTLGLFLWVINAAMLGLTAALFANFAIDGFLAALLGSAIVSFTAWVASWYVGPRGQLDVYVDVRRSRD